MAEPQTRASAKCKSICPHFVVPDVVVSAEYYRDVLGFKIMGYWFDPPVFAIVARDNVEIQLGKSDGGAPPSPNSVRREESLDAYIWVDDVDALCAELQERRAKILEPPTLRVYKCYEMMIEDNCGFRLCFSMDTSSLAS
ncbi:MAG TPA: VOC family protein [Candidatus Acidoferrum sp.]|nr:VOC family protein [Candidatus Acidoferrum sp.]